MSQENPKPNPTGSESTAPIEGLGKERRHYPRLKIEAPTTFTILIPTETFSPYNFKATTTDISLGGLCMRTGQIDKSNYLTLIREVRYVKLDLTLPNLEDPLHLRGRVAWWDFHDARGTKPSFCMLGIAFHTFTEEAKSDFLQILLDLEKFIQKPKA